jgi:hypothetical protein
MYARIRYTTAQLLADVLLLAYLYIGTVEPCLPAPQFTSLEHLNNLQVSMSKHAPKHVHGHRPKQPSGLGAGSVTRCACTITGSRPGAAAC